MNKHLIVSAILTLLPACAFGGTTEPGEGDEAVTDATESLGEAGCGTATVNTSFNYTGGSSQDITRTAPYGSAACTNADLFGIKGPSPIPLSVSTGPNLRLSAANCARINFRSIFYKRGAKVIEASRPGKPVGRVRYATDAASRT